MARSSSSSESRRSSSLGLFGAALVSAAVFMGCTSSTDSTVETEDPGIAEDGVSSSVASAVSNSCSTSSVKGLSKQIIEEARCMNADAYAKMSSLSGVSYGSSVFSYLEKPARDKLTSAIKSKGGKSITINSMLRTIAQQYLLYRWYQTGRCGIGLAAKPGNSNHETGLALDVSQYSSWKGTLQAYGFHWLGSADPVHFDYAGAGAKSYKGVDVKAFQRLWNRNHPEDKIATDGDWGPQTEARMKKSPAGGFAKGATCGSSGQAYEGETDLTVTDSTLDPEIEMTVAEAIADGADLDDADLDGADTAEETHHLDHPETVNGVTAASSDDDACGRCFQTICENDSYCCDTEWDDRCVQTGLTICEALCGAEATRPL
ncbi:MAG: M15 family metallopeptidase [Polyangiaceae bacterium]